MKKNNKTVYFMTYGAMIAAIYVAFRRKMNRVFATFHS